MAKYKVYAVLKGRKTGLFYSYAECEKQIKGFANAVFKGFLNEEEAIEWLESGGREKNTISPGVLRKLAVEMEENRAEKKTVNIEGFDQETYFNEDHLDTNELPAVMPEAYAFVDGSYNDNFQGKKVYGYGGIVHIDGKDTFVHGNGSKEEYVVSRQIPGEVFGSIAAIEKAIELGAKHLVVFYDYAGIGHWATSGKRWKAEKPIAREYVQRYDELSKKIKVNFYHVKAHTNIEGNEEVDRMAKMEVGLL